MILIKETAGDTLRGAVDGVNTVYLTSFSFTLESVNVYINGQLKVRALADGFWVTAPNIVTLKIAALLGDTLEVEYYADTLTGGGAGGGCPNPPQIEVVRPGTNAEEHLPDVSGEDIKSSIASDGELQSNVFTDLLRPVILKPGSEG